MIVVHIFRGYCRETGLRNDSQTPVLILYLHVKVDLYDWIHPLNVIDSGFTWILENYSQKLLLLPPFAHLEDRSVWTSLQQLQRCPEEILVLTATLLQFSAVLLRNSTGKQLYASVPDVSDFMAAADDGIADYAVALLMALSQPPAFHKQQAPDHQVYSTQLHQASSAKTANGVSNTLRTDVLDRLMATSRAWGTRAMGLGLYVTVAADDSVYGQGRLPESMGEVNFCYYNSEDTDSDVESTFQEISLVFSEMAASDGFASSPDYSTASGSQTIEDDEGFDSAKNQVASKKRRKVSAAALDDLETTQKKQLIKSTAELFFLAADKVGGIQNVPSDRWFSLLSDIRLARSFHSRVARCEGVGRRLQALIAILHAHPSHEMMSGYFQAQPELCAEIVDLLRPVVSSANVSVASAMPGASNDRGSSTLRQDAVANLVSDATQNVPFELRMLAVEALTALVSRRDGATSPLSGTARLSSVLIELGVGKGHYLGLLPTMIRYSLASLGSVVNSLGPEPATKPFDFVRDSDDELTSGAFDIGLAFVEATMAPPLASKIQVERALQFIDHVLTLTASVAGTPPGTSALVDCGLIPVLLTTVSLDPEDVVRGLILHQESSFAPTELGRVKSLLRFVTAQAVQILVQVVVTHNNAVTVFHDLQGVEILTTRLSKEILLTRKISSIERAESIEKMDVEGSVEKSVVPNADVGMIDITDAPTHQAELHVLSSQRVVLFSIVTCLTVVFHQESSNSAMAPTGSSQLRRKELSDALLEILTNVTSFGGHLASLVSTLLSDVMNSDPHVVHFVHKSGIADSFLSMVIGHKTLGQGGAVILEPLLPPVPELIMAIPNVISALALTEDGAAIVAERNPFPSLLRLFYHPAYAMPRSRCLLNEMTAIIGTALDEIMRHVDRLKPLVLIAIAEAMNRVALDAEDLLSREEKGKPSVALEGNTIEDERSCLIQYVLNFGQLLEQILHNEEHCEPFVEAGGLDALLRLFPLSMASPVQFLAYVSCLSSPSVSTLHHSTTEEALSVVCKCIEFRYDSLKLLRKLFVVANRLLDDLDTCQRQLQGADKSSFSLDSLPSEPMYKLAGPGSEAQLISISVYLRRVANVQWISGLLGNAIKAACQRSGETGSGWSGAEREWKEELASDAFGTLVGRLSEFHRTSLYEVCRVRTQNDFEFLERRRLGIRSPRLRYRLRVVCTEGAVVRDGIEIDSCTNVGSLEMGDIVLSFDRCINSSGILRYRISRGWVSEMTRGHGREPIVEVINIWECENGDEIVSTEVSDRKRIEAGVPDIRSVSVSVHARGQASFAELFGALSKLVIQGIRTLHLPAAFGDGEAGAYVASMMRILALNVKHGLNHLHVAETARAVMASRSLDGLQISSAGAALYLGCILNQVHTCLFDDKRERRMVNFPLLVKLVVSDSVVDAATRSASATKNESLVGDETNSTVGVFDAIRFVLRHGLSDFVRRAVEEYRNESNEPERQRVGRSVASSFPPLISFIRKLVSTPMSSSPAASIMSRMNWTDISRLLNKDDLSFKFAADPKDDDFFQPESLVTDLLLSLSKIAKEVWTDERLLHTPPFLVHPIACLVGDVMLALEDISKKKSPKSQPRPSERMRLSDLMRQRQEDDSTVEAVVEEHFEVSEDSITRLMDMGFPREHALDALESTRSNRVETAMDYALSNDPPSPSIIQLRQLERDERERLRAERHNSVSDDAVSGAVRNETESGGNFVDTDRASSCHESDGKGSEASTARNVLAMAELDTWIGVVPTVSCHLLSSMPLPSSRRTKQASGQLDGANAFHEGDGDGESEALTVVLCSFVLDFCHKYPEKRSHIVSLVLSQLKAKFSEALGNGEVVYSVAEGATASVAALCHAAVLITQALPKTRLLVLKEGLVRGLVSCIHSCFASFSKIPQPESPRLSLPMWISPAMLLLDIMAQPMVAFTDDDTIKSIDDGSPYPEFSQVRNEHEEQVSELIQMVDRWLIVPRTPEAVTRENTGSSMNEGQPSAVGDEMVVDDGDQKASSKLLSRSYFTTVPAYYPLLPLDLSQACLEICQTILKRSREIVLLPGVAQSALLLLLQLLRTPKLSFQCLQMGVAEAIIALPNESAFNGNTGLVTLIFRRLLDDELSLQTAMETEIRSTVAMLHSKKTSPSKGEMPQASLMSFMEAITPLLCRDPASFFKAMVLSVMVESPDLKSGVTKVSLLSQTKRLQRIGTGTEVGISPNAIDAANVDGRKDDFARQKRPSNGSKLKCKLSSRGWKRGSPAKKGKKEKSDTTKNVVGETPAAHVAGLLIHSIVASASADASENAVESFLSTGNLLEILADLVLAVPACASAVHNCRPYRSKDKSKRVSIGAHPKLAISQHAPPPKTFVTFLLHSLLPHDRWTIRNDPQIWGRRKDLLDDEAVLVKANKKKACGVLKVTQTAGRLLVALVLRPGEGRKRVIADLATALSGGRLGHVAGQSTPVAVTEHEMVAPSISELHALHAWGEVCLAIAAPRGNGKNLDGVSSLSIENIRLMLEYGMVHALLHSLHRVRIFHPMASNTYAALLLPLEVLTRASVTDAVTNLAKKERQPNDAMDELSANLTPAAGAPLDSAHDAMDEESTHDDVARRNHNGNLGVDYGLLVEVEDNEIDEDGSPRGDGIANDEGHSSDDDSGDDEEDDESEEDEMDDDEGSDVEDSDDGSSEEVEEEEEGWDVGYNNFTDDGPEYEAEEEDVTERIDDNAVGEGWTRVESNGFGGMLMGESRLGGGVFGADNEPPPARSRGFIDAAEAMIGSLLRNGDISGDALAEIEGTLGIRITQGGRALRGTLGSGRNEGTPADTLVPRTMGRGTDGARSAVRGARGEVVGTLPYVHQRNQPDVGYSSFGRSGQWVEISSIEYVYGGPSVTGGSSNYDVVTPFQRDFDPDDELSLYQQDLQIFPGGPASATSTRTQHSLHPLLCGVDLPPVNSLVSDLLPHGVRATRRCRMATRRPGDWTNASYSPVGGYLVSTSNGNIIRSDRQPTRAALGSGLSDRNIAGPAGWTVDGLFVDATVEEFSSALETALDRTARWGVDSVVQGSTAYSAGAFMEPNRGVAGHRDESSAVASLVFSDVADVPLHDSTGTSDNGEMMLVSQNMLEVDSVRSEGDGVASSLVASLRLSTDSETHFAPLQSGVVGNSQPLAEATATNLDVATVRQLQQESNVGVPPPDDATVPRDNPDGMETARIESIPFFATDPLDSNAEAVSGEDVITAHEPASRDNVGLPLDVAPYAHGLVCPPDVDLEVFNSLPIEMQQDCVDQYSATQELAAQLDGSTLDPEVLAALPEEMRREIIEQDRQERRRRERDHAPADPSQAEEMDNASFIASLAPELREEILLSADDTFLNSLPPGIVAEAQILRERASVQQRRLYDNALGGATDRENVHPGGAVEVSSQAAPNGDVNGAGSRRRQRSGKLKVETNRAHVLFLPKTLSSPFAVADVKVLFRLMYLLSPVQPTRLLQKVFLNLCANPCLRDVFTSTLIKLLHEESSGAEASVEKLSEEYDSSDGWRKSTDAHFSRQDDFPPSMLLGAAPEVPELEALNMSVSASLLRRRQGNGTAASLAANLPKSAGGANHASSLPPVVAARLVDTVLQLCKSPRVCLHTLVSVVKDDGDSSGGSTCFEKLIDLLDKPTYANSSSNLDQLLTLLESAVAPLSHISKRGDEEVEISQRDVDAAAAQGKEYVDVPRVMVSQARLQLLCSILRMETCRDTAFAKVNTIVRRLCRVEMNRGVVLAELASVAHSLGVDAIRDLRSLRIRMDHAVSYHKMHPDLKTEAEKSGESSKSNPATLCGGLVGSISSSVTISTSTSEMKLLRVLQTLQALCNDSGDDQAARKNENSVIVTDELVHLLRQMKFDELWDELSSCLKVVQVLEGVKTFEEEEQRVSEDMETNDEGSGDGTTEKTRKLRNSAAGLLTRFLPSIEAFFVANASATRPVDSKQEGEFDGDDIALENLVGGQRMIEFVTTNRVLLNALIRNNASLLDKGLRALVQVPRCRGLMDFDVKRQWFKTQVRRLRQQASRRHGSLRLHIRRKTVFEDAYHQLQPRNADEMRGRLHVTFRNEEGVDAGGLSREFFGILAKEMFNPNYALFTSTEDGCTFQPNPNSIINPDHLSYFRFVGRVVGKAVADGFLLDAHFTRSLYKHMLGVQPTHHDMEAIDPDFYRSLKTILEFNLSDIGLDLNFSIDDLSFGRSQVIDLLPSGRLVPVTEENKEEYVRLVCQHRMTTAIQSQIKSYLAGFYELVNPELIAIFTPRELELLISGLPDIDLHDLKKNTDYMGWKATDKTIEWFWNILFSLSRNEKAAFLQFVTGSSKVPLAGFAELQGMRGIQKFAIHKAGGTKGALMSAHTCFNSLDLPVYESEVEMREKLLYAINEGGGAFLFA